MISNSAVFEAVQRGYNELEDRSHDEILDYFSSIEVDSISGHISNIKGVLFELEYVDQLALQGIESQLFEATNHPITDIAILNDGDIVTELQLKATDSVGYINATINEHPDITIVATSEVANSMKGNLIINSGIENSALEEAVSNTLFEETINPISPLSILGWCFGLF